MSLKRSVSVSGGRRQRRWLGLLLLAIFLPSWTAPSHASPPTEPLARAAVLSATPTAPRARAYPAALRASRRTLASQAPIASQAQLGPAHLHGSDALLGYDIHAGLGNLYLATTDIVAYPALGPQLVFERHYNSQGGDIDVGLGRGWTHSYAWRIAMPDPATVQLLCDTGRTLLFKLAGDGIIPNSGVYLQNETTETRSTFDDRRTGRALPDSD